jgi:hypothetical protein
MTDDVTARRPLLARPVVRVVLVAIGIFVVLQLIPVRISNPAVVSEPDWDSARTRSLAAAACFDCHSNETRSAWYEKVAPVSWWLKGHVEEGRDALNWSECGTGEGESDEASETVREGSMPPSYYTWLGLHSDAKLSAAERQQLADGLDATAARGCK